MSFYVYHYCDPKSGTPFYVGKGCGLRAQNHLTLCKNSRYKSYDTFFYRKLRKMLLLGNNPNIKFVKEHLEEQEALEFEISEIKRIGRRDTNEGPLTNLTDGGEGASGHKMSDETKQKLREITLGKVRSKETRQRMREATLGMKHTEETKQRMSTIGKGRKYTKETRQRMSKSQRGKITSQETRRKMSASQPRKPVEGFDIPNNLVCQFEGVGRVVDGGFRKQCVSACLNGRQKTHKGLFWRYSHA